MKINSTLFNRCCEDYYESLIRNYSVAEIIFNFVDYVIDDFDKYMLNKLQKDLEKTYICPYRKLCCEGQHILQTR